MNQNKFQRTTISHVFIHLHIKLHVYSDFVICANTYLQKLKAYSADKTKTDQWKLQNSKFIEYKHTVEIQ